MLQFLLLLLLFQVVVSDQAAHLPRLRANIALNEPALRRHRATQAARAAAWAVPGRGWATQAAPPPPAAEDTAGDAALNVAATAVGVRAAALEWGDSGAAAAVGRAFDVVVCCETLHWPALDLWQVMITKATRSRLVKTPPLGVTLQPCVQSRLIGRFSFCF